MITIKPIYGNWKQVTKEQAKEFIKHILSSGITCHNISKCESKDTYLPKLYKYIEKTYLKGITVEKLLSE